MGDRRIFLMMAAAYLFVSAVPGHPADGATGTPCTFELELWASPGLTTSPSSGTVTTNGQNGTITCDGPVNGKQPTGPGTTGFEGRYGTKRAYSCQDDGQGEGVQSIAIPVQGGAERIANAVTYTHGAYQDGRPFSGTFQGDRMSGTFEARPVEGDCVSKPMTRFHVQGKGTLT